jgi:serine/tyrosine/threonine adenylyltransferase
VLPATAEELDPFVAGAPAPPRAEWLAWRDSWWHGCQAVAARQGATAEAAIAAGLLRWNLPETPVRSVIERIWAAIAEQDDWSPLKQWLAQTM